MAEPDSLGVSSANPPVSMASGSGGATDGADVEASWINAQIGQSKSAKPFDFWPWPCAFAEGVAD